MDLAHAHKMRALFHIKLIQIRGMLKIIAVKITRFHYLVRLYIIVKYRHLQIPAFLCQNRLCRLQYFRMGYFRSGNRNRSAVSALGAAASKYSCCQNCRNCC